MQEGRQRLNTDGDEQSLKKRNWECSVKYKGQQSKEVGFRTTADSCCGPLGDNRDCLGDGESMFFVAGEMLCRLLQSSGRRLRGVW